MRLNQISLTAMPGNPSSPNSEMASLATHAEARAINGNSLDAGLLDAVVRLVRLLDTPSEASFLAPLIMREIVYRLLRGEQGDRLRHIAVHSGYTPPIAKAIDRLRKNLDQAFRIKNIARELGVSVSGFHHHFKAVTAAE